eukprot:Skav200488  [mRNA]  locus=scaffold450:179249:185277:+ [translate_table: standard]
MTDRLPMADHSADHDPFGTTSDAASLSYAATAILSHLAVHVGKSFRNEIAPRQGLTRQREFTQAEIEWFVKPTAKEMRKFEAVSSEQLLLYSSELQLSGQSVDLPPSDTQRFAAQENDHWRSSCELEAEATKQRCNGSMDHKTGRGSLRGRTYLFLTSIGIKADHCRFRSGTWRRHGAMAGKCEVNTCPQRWLTMHVIVGMQRSKPAMAGCVGIADRACFDLNAHAQAAKVDLAFRETLEQPIEMDVLRLKKEAGVTMMKAFKKIGRPVKAMNGILMSSLG